MKSILSKAIQIAVEAHADQFDKGGNPYILHPLKVMHYLKSKDEELMAIAVLHDVVEDNKNWTWERLLEEGMPERVVKALVCLTKMPGQSHGQYKAAVKSNKDAILVKMADLRHNSDIRRLKGVTDKDIERVVKYQRFFLELQGYAKEIKLELPF